MMRFQVTQDLPAAPDAVARALTDPALYATYVDLAKIAAPVLVDRVERGDRITVSLRYRFTGDLNGPARALIDADKLTWIDVATHDLATGTTEFELRPDHYAGQFRARGTYQLSARQARTRRVGDIEVSVAVPVVGRAVERAIASGLREHLDEEAIRIADFVRTPRR